MATNPEKSEYDQIKEFINLCFKHWYYFVISMFICGVIGIFYFINKNRVYSVVSQVSIRHDESLFGTSISSTGSSMLSAFGLGRGSSDNVEDETLKLASHGYMKKVVRSLKLNTNYTQTKFLGFNKTPLYDQSPLVLDIDDSISDTISSHLKFVFKITPEETVVSLKNGFKNVIESKITSFPAVLETPFGNFTISKSKYFNDYEYPMDVVAFYGNYDYWAQIYGKAVAIDFEKKTSDIIHLSTTSECVSLSKKILTTIVEIYNEEWSTDKSIVTNKTIEVIDEQLMEAESLLSEVDRNIQSFKNKYQLTEIEADVTSYLTQSGELQADLLKAQTQLSLVEVITDFVTNPENKYALVPFSLSTSNPAFSEIISDYNRVLMKRNENIQSDTNSPLIQSYENQIEVMHKTLSLSLKNIEKELQISLNTLKKKDQDLNKKLGNIPQIERDYVQLKREQELRQGVYVFLLEMRAQALVKGVSLLPKLKTINAPYVLNKAVSPNLMKIALVVLFLGAIVFPFTIIFGLPYLKRRKNK